MLVLTHDLSRAREPWRAAASGRPLGRARQKALRQTSGRGLRLGARKKKLACRSSGVERRDEGFLTNRRARQRAAWAQPGIPR